MRVLPLLLLVSCAALVTARPPATVSLAPAVVDAGIPGPSLTDQRALDDGGVLVALVIDGGVGELAEDTELTGGDEPGEGEAAGEEPGDEVAGQAPSDAGWQYTVELSDEALAKSWKQDLPSLGSISMGFVQEGRLINGVPFPPGDGWTVVSPDATYGTQETVEFVASAIRQVKAWYPDRIFSSLVEGD